MSEISALRWWKVATSFNVSESSTLKLPARCEEGGKGWEEGGKGWEEGGKGWEEGGKGWEEGGKGERREWWKEEKVTHEMCQAVKAG